MPDSMTMPLEYLLGTTVDDYCILYVISQFQIPFWQNEEPRWFIKAYAPLKLCSKESFIPKKKEDKISFCSSVAGFIKSVG